MTAAGYDRERLSPATQTPAASATVTPDMALGKVWVVQMPAGNITIANPINTAYADVLTLIIIQDAVGTRLVTWGSAYKKLITLSVVANSRDSVTYRFDGTNWNQIGSALAIA